MPTTTVQHKRDTAAIWAASGRILATGQIGVETDTGKFKIGDGTNVWSALAYRGGPTSPFSLTLFDDTTAAAWLATLGHTVAANTMNAISNVIGVRHTVSATLTNAQIIALPTTPITIVSAPGGSLINLPLMAYIWVDAAAGVYTNIDADAELKVDCAAGFEPLHALKENDGLVSTLLGTASVNAATLGGQAYAEPLSSLDNEVIQIRVNNQGSGVFTGGNAANTARVTVEYIVIPV